MQTFTKLGYMAPSARDLRMAARAADEHPIILTVVVPELGVSDDRCCARLCVYKYGSLASAEIAVVQVEVAFAVNYSLEWSI